MARTDTLSHFLSDVATAIKTKIGDSTPIPASDFDTEIMSITVGGNYQTKSMNITTNGNYVVTPDTGYDAIERLSITALVNPNLQNKTIIQNGSYTADTGYDGLDTVTINVPPNVIIFQSPSAMAQDTITGNYLEGRLAMSYIDEWLPTSGDNTIVNTIHLPATVTLDQAVTTTITGTYYRNSGTLIYDYTIELTPTSYRAYRTRSAGTIAEYSSSDGITYTRTTQNDEWIFDVRNGWEAVWSDTKLNEFCLSRRLDVTSVGIWSVADLMQFLYKPVYEDGHYLFTAYYKYPDLDDLAEFLFQTVFPDVGISFTSRRYIPIVELSHNVFELYFTAKTGASYNTIKFQSNGDVGIHTTSSSSANIKVVHVDMTNETYSYTTMSTSSQDDYKFLNITASTHWNMLGLWNTPSRGGHYFDQESPPCKYDDSSTTDWPNIQILGWKITNLE